MALALTERSRNKIYESFSTLIDDEKAVEEMLSYFPARDIEEPATKEHLRAEMADLRTEMADLRAELKDEMNSMVRTMQAWFVGTGISLAGVMVALARFG